MFKRRNNRKFGSIQGCRFLRLGESFHSISVWLFLCFLALAGCSQPKPPETDDPKKRALAEGVSNQAAAEYFTYRSYKEKDGKSHQHVPDFFRGMDAISQQDGEAPRHDALLDEIGKTETVHRTPTRVASPKLSVNERVGRNTWMAWSSGNEGFWDWLCTNNLGFIDLLKLVDSRNRNRRFADSGLINEPEMEQAHGQVRDEFGLLVDIPADHEIRTWRENYVNQTFTDIGAGKHKLQVGLKMRGASGDYDGPAIYRGDADRFKGQGYRYPSEYLDQGKRGKKNANSASRYGEAATAKYGTGYDEIDPRYPSEGYENRLDETVPPPDLYGLSSGVIGLRLFPNPYFDKAAQDRWDAEKFYNDPAYYNDPNLVRPYRVGMSCAFCHASYHPLKPPLDVANPTWENISGNIGAQYLSMRATVGGQLTPDQFAYHLLDSQPRGTIDTSLIASDNINNPNTMNAFFGLKQRAFLSLYNPRESLSSESSRLPSLWRNPDPSHLGDGIDVVPDEIYNLAQELGKANQLRDSNDSERHVPRILLDGSDSIGMSGALARVYLNIGSYWQQWNQLHQVVIGFTPQQPFRLADCEEYSVYWNATEKRVPGMRDYFLKITSTMPLLSTENGASRIIPVRDGKSEKKTTIDTNDFEPMSAKERALHVDANQLATGRKAFARNCIVCHSSIQPESSMLLGKEVFEKLGISKLVERRIKVRDESKENGEVWEHIPVQWLGDPEYQKWAETVVAENKFWSENYLSTDYRIPINLVNTNSARAMGTNGMTGHMWEDFASESYRELPSVGQISYFNPYKGEKGEMDQFSPRHINPNTGKPDGGGGPGFYRVPTLMSIWATAPLLHNNSLGLFNNDPSVDGRLLAFDDAMQKMLWPKKRLESSSYNEATAERLQRDHGLIWRTNDETYLALDAKRVPYFAARLPFIARLHQHLYLHWLDRVQPHWLPTVIFFVGALLILLLSNSQKRRGLSIVFFTIAIVGGVTLWLSNSYPNLKWLAALRSIQPWLLPIAIVGLIGLALWLPLRAKFMRWIGYVLVVAGLLVGLIVYFNSGKLGDVRIGPIPKGTPINLLANFNPEADKSTQLQAVSALVSGLSEIKSRNLQGDDAVRVLTKKIAPEWMKVNKCPDFVMDKGHYFPWFDRMTDEDKEALIELLKTL